MKFALSLLALMIATGCGPIEPSGTPGALHEVGFHYYDLDSSGPFPARIGVGSGFSISVDDTGFGLIDSNEVLTSGDPRKLEELPEDDGDQGYQPDFRALDAGAVNISMRESPDGGADPELVDYITVHLAPVARFELRACERGFNAIRESGDPFRTIDCARAGAEQTTVVISRGESLAPTFCALPLDAGERPVGGYFEIEWEQVPAREPVLQINVSESNRCATIGGLRLGSARVVARFEEHTMQLDVEVEP